MRPLAFASMLMALVSQAAAQTYPRPFGTATYSLTGQVAPGYYPLTRYLYTAAQDIDALPASLVTWFNNTYAPYWSMGTDFNSVPEFMAKDLYVRNFTPNGVFIYPPVAYVNNAVFHFDGQWEKPLYNYPEAPQLYYPHNGKQFWEVVVKKDSGGNYSLVPGSGGGSTPSYYNLSPGGADDANSNLQNAPYGAKNITLDVTKNVTTLQTQTDLYYVMLCQWSINGPYIGITVRDAVLVTTINSKDPIYIHYPTGAQSSPTPLRDR